MVRQNSSTRYSVLHLKFTGKANAKLSSGQARPKIHCMKDIFSTSFDSDYHFLGFSKSELNMATAGSGRDNEEVRINRKSHRCDNKYKEDAIGTNLVRNGDL